MPHRPTRLALLISLIGLGMPASQRALAREDDRWAHLPVLERAWAPPQAADASDEFPPLPAGEPTNEEFAPEQGYAEAMGTVPAAPCSEPAAPRTDGDATSAVDGDTPPPPMSECDATALSANDGPLTLEETPASADDPLVHLLATRADIDTEGSIASPAQDDADRQEHIPSLAEADEPVHEPGGRDHEPPERQPLLAPTRPGREPPDTAQADGPLAPAQAPQPAENDAAEPSATFEHAAESLPQVEVPPHRQAGSTVQPRGFLAALGHALRAIFLGGPTTAAEKAVNAEAARPARPAAHMRMVAGLSPQVSAARAASAQAVAGSHAAKVVEQLARVLEDGRARQETSRRAQTGETDNVGSARQHAGPLPGIAQAMSEDHLDGVRGGFSTPDGLTVAFGIERAVYINGELVSTTRLNFANGQPPATPAAGDSALALVQDGATTTVVRNAIPTVIQNALDGQRIQSLTTINATVNSLQVLRGMQMQSTLTQAIVDSLRR